MNNDVRARRERRDLSQADLAEAVGVTRQTINSIERGRYDPSLELAFALADFFGCRIEELFDPGGDGDPDADGDATDPA
ncbi:helix-turn-helix transcriptional regulator [Halobaculum sp. CBA1158]|uniref:helix-turn-helix transcriptional regulator n=1 Tax=Halobaculum sp. CBA1158 TaxID=2904243 RepID=UPI001F3F0CBF|nr:helix-turn-helix transcriptional regulator [Halobaculum sp. CBA1158]UIO99424.1 helix-turn-helix transcriptional regulator [Halobaculum sp. CBA1158]